MTHLSRLVSAVLLASLGMPALALGVEARSLAPVVQTVPSGPLLARGGGAARGGGRASTGLSAAGSGLNRGTSRPSGGWSSRVPSDRVQPSLSREGSRLGHRNGASFDGNGLNRNVNRDVNRNINRNINRDVNRNISGHWGRNVNLNRVNLYPGWARPGWAVARPWNYGWYGGWSTPAWGWWGARAAAWGITTLATAAVINAAVNSAVQNQVSYIVVPDTNLQLLYGTVQPSGSNGVSFLVTDNGNSYQLTADCQSGSLNGNVPASAAEAELVNAACQVAYGSA